MSIWDHTVKKRLWKYPKHTLSNGVGENEEGQGQRLETVRGVMVSTEVGRGGTRNFYLARWTPRWAPSHRYHAS